MSSTIVADSTEDKDDSLIIIVNADGTITVDPETLQKLIANQGGGNVSVVRVDSDGNASSEDHSDSQDASHVNLTVEGFYSHGTQEVFKEVVDIPNDNDSSANDVVVDPFSQMEPEHIARLESALQSEQAKEILGHKLGENLTEMLDILEGNDEPKPAPPPPPAPQPVQQQHSIHQHHQIEHPMVHNDHSYTSMAPIFHPQPVVVQQSAPQPILHHRPLTRGGRARVRGTGRILTRGGVSARPPAPVVAAANATPPKPTVQPQQISQPTLVTTIAPKTVVTTKNIIVAQGGRLVTQPGADVKVPKKLIVPKVQSSQPPPLVQSARVTNLAGPTPVPVTSANAVIVRTNPVVLQKKAIVRGGRGGPVIARGNRKNIRGGMVTTVDKTTTLRKVEPKQQPQPSKQQPQPPKQPPQSPKQPPQSPKQPPQSPKQPPQSPKQQPQSPKQQPQSPKQQPQLAKQQPQPEEEKVIPTTLVKVETPTVTVITPKKRTPAVVLKKLSQKVIDASTGEAKQPVTPKNQKVKEVKIQIPEVTKPQPKEIKEPPPPPTPAPTVAASTTTPTPPVISKVVVKTPETEEVKRKKEKTKDKSALPPVLGPELFSTPDIIRRVSTDKTVSDTTDHASTVQPPQAILSISQPPTVAVAANVQTTQTSAPQSSPVQSLKSPTDMPKVQVQPLHPPIIPAKCEEMSAESLLDSIHAEVAKSDSSFLADTLLFDDLTNDEDAMGAIKHVDNQIEETLEKMEDGKCTDTPTFPTLEVAKTPSAPSAPTPAADSSQTKTPTVRKLPPIELPATRSATKKAAAAASTKSPATTPASTKATVATAVVPKTPAKAAQEVQTPQRDNKNQKTGKSDAKRGSVDSRKSSADKKQAKEEDSDFDEEIETDDESWNSEDDPDRLWCICKKPHNNRFMICCDGCEEWFHGKCVGITKALGQQMEQQGVEWSCPNCKEAKLNAANKQVKEAAQKPVAQKPAAAKPPAGQQTISSLECIICKKPAKASSNFCNHICIKKHVLIMLASLKKETEGLHPSTRVVVYEKKTGRLLSGEKAPTVQGLADWLTAHQSFEVVRPSILPVNKYYKAATPKQAPAAEKQVPLKQAAEKQVPLKQAAEKQVPLKQSVLSTKVTPTGTPRMGFSPKEAVTQKTIQVISPQPMPAQAPAKAKVEEAPAEKNKRGKVSPTTPTAPVVEKKKEEKVEAKPKRDRKPSEKAAAPTKQETPKQEEPPKPQPEPIRANVKRTLQELLSQRVQQDPDVKITPEEVKELVESIEDELFNVFKDTGAKYKSKYRSLVFNIKDVKNLTLYKKIVDKSISPSQLVRLSPEELASQELAQWREKEAKHQIEIIKKNELDLIHQAKTVVLKSRKGEEVIESKNHEANISELESALNRTAEDYELEKQEKKEEEPSPLFSLNFLNSLEKKKVKVDKKEDKRRDRKKDKKRSRRSGSRSKERHRSKSISKERHRSRSKSKDSSKKSRSDSKDNLKRSRSKSRGRSRKRSRSKSNQRSKSTSTSKDRKRKDSKERKLERTNSLEPKKEKEESLPATTSEDKFEEIEQSLTPPPPKMKDDDLSDREPSSTVIISTPPYAEEKPPFWSGILNMSEVTKLHTSAYEVSGSCEDLDIELSSNLECVGRIQPDSVWDYVCRMKKAGTKDIIVIRFQSESEEEKMNYLSLYSYLNSRNRMAVVGHTSKTVKDFYVLPLASHSPIPQVLLPLDGPGFEDYRPHLLLGIIIRTKKGSLGTPLSSLYTASSSTPPPQKRKKLGGESSKLSVVGERSYTPPLPDGGSTPPLPSSIKRLPIRGLTPPLPDMDDEPYSPGEDDPYSPDDTEAESIIVKPNPDIQRNLDEVNRMIEEKRQKIESMTSSIPPNSIPGIGGDSSFSVQDIEEDAYSPSSRFTPPPSSESIPFFDSKSLPDIKLPSNLQEILASIKAPQESVNGQIRTMDVNSDPIVKAYTSSAMYLDEDDDDDKSDSTSEPIVEKTSRDPRQRPEKLSKTSLSQLTDADLIRKAAEMEDRRGEPKPPPPELYYPTQLAPPPLPPLPAFPPQQIPYPKGPPPPPMPSPRKRQHKEEYHPAPPLPPPLPAHKDFPPLKEYDSPSHKNFTSTSHKEFSPHKEDFSNPERRNRKWDHRGPPHRGGGGGGPRHNRGFRRGFNRGGFRGSGNGGNGRFPHRRGGGGGFRGHPPSQHRGPAPKYDGVQSEWDEEIRNFEQRKARELDRERRKRRVSRSPSPRRRRARRNSSDSS